MLTYRIRASLRPFIEPLRERSPRLEVLALLLIVSESIIVYVFAGSLLATTSPPHQPLPFLLILLLFWFARTIPLILSTTRIWDSRYQLIMGTSILLSALLTIRIGAFSDYDWLSLNWLSEAGQSLILRESEAARSVWFLIGLIVLAWWRGRSRSEPSLETAHTMLRLGLIWLVGGAVLTLMIGSEDLVIVNHLPPALASFITVSLVSIAIARQPEFDHPTAPQSGWLWPLVLVVPAIAIAAVAVTATGILNRDALDLIIIVVSPVFWVVHILLQGFVLALALIAFVLISPLIWFLERQGFEPMANFPQLNLSPGTGMEADEASRTGLTIDDPVRFLIVSLILVVIFYGLIRFLFRRSARWKHRDDPHNESLIDWQGPRALLLATVRNWIARATRRPPDDLPDGPEWEFTRRIRVVYRQFLKFQARSGHPKSPNETPTRFAERISDTEPFGKTEITQITELYDHTRYSGQPANAESATAVETAWRALQEQGKSSP
jgi:hypothetical protein